MKLFEVTLTCDHYVLVLAATPEGALDVAEVEAHRHGVEVQGGTSDVVEVVLDGPRFVAIVPGLWSRDAAVDPEGAEA